MLLLREMSLIQLQFQQIYKAYKCDSKDCFWILALLRFGNCSSIHHPTTDTTTSNIKVLISYFNMADNRHLQNFPLIKLTFDGLYHGSTEFQHAEQTTTEPVLIYSINIKEHFPL